MSTFRQLMFGKRNRIKHYMDLTVVGSPTISNGVVSGFSNDNYLKLQQPFAPVGKWEVVICTSTSTYNLANSRYFFGCYGTGNIILGTTSTTHSFKAFISTNNGSSYNIQITTTEEAVADTMYFIKLGFDGSKYYIEQSRDGETYTGRAEQASTDKISSADVFIGKAYQDGYNWTKEINLNNSYIKLNNTKYQFRFAMPLTVVGSPTITDGVVSGFSANNYLTLPTINFSNINSWEFVFKVKMVDIYHAKYFFGNMSGNSIVVGNTDSPGGAFKIFLSSNGTSWDIGNMSTNISNPANSIRYVRFGFTGTKYYVEQSSDGITYTNKEELSSSDKLYSSQLYLGKAYQDSRYWQGNIDLNESFAIIDGTKYIFTL